VLWFLTAYSLIPRKCFGLIYKTKQVALCNTCIKCSSAPVTRVAVVATACCRCILLLMATSLYLFLNPKSSDFVSSMLWDCNEAHYCSSPLSSYSSNLSSLISVSMLFYVISSVCTNNDDDARCTHIDGSH